MIPDRNLEIYATVTLFVLAKIVCAIVLKYRGSMYNKNKDLASIPERDEREDEGAKWVPKVKHETLKAKYKFLKKLFQIYEASVIRILPENYPDTYKEPYTSHRRKRSHRTKVDACAGTTEASNGDVSLTTVDNTVTSIINELNLQRNSSTEVSETTVTKNDEKFDKSTQDSKDVSTDCNNDKENECVQTSEAHPLPYLVFNEKRPTRLQSFINRIMGIRADRENFLPIDQIYAISDNTFSNSHKRKRRGIRLRRRRTRTIRSEIALRDTKSPMILSCVQSVQKSCLMDITPRQCPILGCSEIFYGIINYNDHLNLCHFSDRKYACHYCHEGFTNGYDKIIHENQHIGITKVAANLLKSALTARESRKVTSNTQTDPEVSKRDVPEEKLKKMVSFFDKIAETNQGIDRTKNRYSESNLQSMQQSAESQTTDVQDLNSSSTEKRILSSADMEKSGRKSISSGNSDRIFNFSCGHRLTCRFCGENFDSGRQLSLHVDIEHRAHKFSQFHSCPVFVSHAPRMSPQVSTEDARINVQSLGSMSTQSTYTEVSRTKSVEALNCPSANVVYYTSLESVDKKPSTVGTLARKVRYKWEPGTKIIRV